MQAVIWTAYGPPPVLELREVPRPVPQDNDLLIKIHATTVTAGDCEMRRLDFPAVLSLPMRAWIGFRKPRPGTIIGTELAGEVVEAGPGVTGFRPGDRVFGAMGMALGTNAQYVCVPAEPEGADGGVAHMPANMDYNEAATVPFGARDALHFLRLGALRPGQKLLINGAGGSIGTFAVQLAKLEGVDVTAVDSAPKLAMLRDLGADHVIDYTQTDFTQEGVVYDVIFDVVGTVDLARGAAALAPGGAYLLANPLRGQILRAPWMRMTSSYRVITQTASPTIADLVTVRELIEARQLRTVIDRTYPLAEIVAAHRYVETGQKAGNVVITVPHENGN